MAEEYDGVFTLCPDVTITQDDVRQVQLAKSAIRAGLETLVETAGIRAADVKRLYIAGGFGKNLNVEKCCGIGLIPSELKDKCVLSGNTSLSGTIKYACGEITNEMIRDVKARTRTVNFAGLGSFRQKFIENMDFN